jgi:hypothetical protein
MLKYLSEIVFTKLFAGFKSVEKLPKSYNQKKLRNKGVVPLSFLVDNSFGL